MTESLYRISAARVRRSCVPFHFPMMPCELTQPSVDIHFPGLPAFSLIAVSRPLAMAARTLHSSEQGRDGDTAKRRARRIGGQPLFHPPIDFVQDVGPRPIVWQARGEDRFGKGTQKTRVATSPFPIITGVRQRYVKWDGHLAAFGSLNTKALASRSSVSIGASHSSRVRK